MDIKDTKTAENLRKALAGESIARNKYTYFAQAARASGDEEAAAAFEQMAKNEMMHAKFWFELLYGKPGDTRECLTQAAMGEYSEWHDMYPDFAAQAREERKKQQTSSQGGYAITGEGRKRWAESRQEWENTRALLDALINVEEV